MKKQEVELLFNISQSDGHQLKEHLQRFAAIRALQWLVYPDFVREICKAETIEGSAEFVGLKALKQLSNKAFLKQVESHRNRLLDKDLLFDHRRLAYITGALMLLLAEQIGLSWDQSIKDQTQTNFQLLFPGIEALDEVPKFSYELIRQVENKQNEIRVRIKQFEKEAQKVELDSPASICGYDPMNMWRYGDKIFCSHFVFLMVDGQMQTLEGEIVLHMLRGSPNEVQAYSKK